MASIFDVARYFIAKVDRDAGDEITHLKLQKLCYYAQAWNLAFEGEPLMDAQFEAWPHGPVCPELFQEYKQYEWRPIENELDYFNMDSLTQEEESFLDEIWDVYGKYTAKHLERLTHQELPWIEARGGLAPGDPSRNVISEKTMQEYYSKAAEEDGEE